MRYYIIHTNKIYIAENQNTFSNLGYIEQVYELPEDYSSEKYIVQEGELILNPNYEEEQAQKAIEQRNTELDEKINYLNQLKVHNIGDDMKIKEINSIIQGLQNAKL